MLINFRDFFNLDYWRELLSFDIFSWSFLVNVLDVIVVWYLVYKLIPVSYTHLDVYKRQVS
ncbi:hypothetical protein A5885_000413 [Enterococcus sp. 8E11_MSG4843]|nr:hypothetical protein A5885_000413 [Enterococcus sp. 8E11_MSG4843]